MFSNALTTLPLAIDLFEVTGKYRESPSLPMIAVLIVIILAFFIGLFSDGGSGGFMIFAFFPMMLITLFTFNNTATSVLTLSAEVHPNSLTEAVKATSVINDCLIEIKADADIVVSFKQEAKPGREIFDYRVKLNDAYLGSSEPFTTMSKGDVIQIEVELERDVLDTGAIKCRPLVKPVQ